MTAVRFWSKVNQTSDCWLWTGAKLQSGYGSFRFHRAARLAHRVAWELVKGPLPPWTGQRTGVCVLHRCDNMLCVNPDHLFLGTQADNMADRGAKGRHPRLHGESHGGAKLTESQVAAIRSDPRPQGELAAIYGVHKAHIGHIRRGDVWKHVA